MNLFILLAVASPYWMAANEVSAALLSTFDPRCNIDNGIVADMNACSSFLVCLQGRVRRKIMCSKGLRFNIQRHMCDYQHRVRCGLRPLTSNASSADCFLSNIELTIRVQNNARQPFFDFQTTVSAPRQPLVNFLYMAAGRDERFRFESQQVENFGMFVTSYNGLEADPAQLTVWLPFDRQDQQITFSIEEYVPQDRETILFRLFSFAEGLGAQTVTEAVRARLISNSG